MLYNRTDNVHPLGARLLQGTDDQRRHGQPLAAQARASSVTAAEAVVVQDHLLATSPPTAGRATTSIAEGLLCIFLVWPFTSIVWKRDAELNVTHNVMVSHSHVHTHVNKPNRQQSACTSTGNILHTSTYPHSQTCSYIITCTCR